MRNELSGKACKMTEVNLILNLDDNTGSGTHWVCLYIKNNSCYFFDSFGFAPPLEIQDFCSGKDLYYNTFKLQRPNEIVCGQLSLYVLFYLSQGISFEAILDKLYRRHK